MAEKLTIDIVANPAAEHQIKTAQALGAGLRRHGAVFRIVPASSQATADIVACWGWRAGERHAARGACVLVMERGYAGDRFAWTSLGWNGLNGRAQFPVIDDGGARWRKHFGGLMRRKRGRRRGSYTLVLGQVRGDAALGNLDVKQFYSMLARRLPKPVRFRIHPVEARRYGSPRGGMMHGMHIIAGTLEEALKGARAAVAWNSNALTEAALAGVPVLACDEGAMVWPIAGQGVDARPALGDREPWAHRLAWCQWRMEEIESGEAWAAVGGDVAPWN